MNRRVLERVLPLAALLAMGLIFVGPAFRGLENWGIQDWDVALFFSGAPRVSLVEYGELPLWNPWWCGGTPLLARPESPWLSPLFLAVLAFGAVTGLKLLIAVYLLIGLTGLYLVGLHVGMRRTSAVFAAMLFMFSGPFTAHVVAGNTWAFHMAWLPWIFLGYVRSTDRASWSLLAMAALVLTWFGGGPYLLVLGLLLIGIHGVGRVLAGDARPIPMAALLAAITAGTLALGAAKFLPAIEFMRQYPRVDDSYVGFSLGALLYGLFGRDQSVHAIARLPNTFGFWHGVSHGMNEIGAYFGVLPFLLAVWGMVAKRRQHLALLFCLVVFLWLGFGHRAPLSLWTLVERIPIVGAMRVPERCGIPLVLCLSLFAGHGLDALWARVGSGRRRWRGRTAILVILIATFLDQSVVVGSLFRQAFPIRPLRVPSGPGGAFAQIATHYAIGPNGWAAPDADTLLCAWSSHYPALLSNLGIVDGYEEIPVPRNPIPSDVPEYPGEVFVAETRGTARFTEWRPNTMRIEATLEKAGYVVVNQNYYPGWHATGGFVVESVAGLLGVRVGPGPCAFQLRYTPFSVVLGMVISTLSIFVALVWLWSDLHRDRRCAGR